ncbi:hypothetical protein I3843_05G164000 [Carya illinoinensis]|uniref:Uncharacterized protein n=1 Tax=Carya illinoinensis TaxID=32201 RepID=A0A8T1P943_CARIL|nr:hypothetical protein CIPAW_10G080400 [Carya illinoinensis]KAG6691750.1 hypothetical protein I3842_10G079400 [Carya illinoinensis]KAG7980101.1 hypothetical protein I3843_05G164000 [Carya illinoinensis]
MAPYCSAGPSPNKSASFLGHHVTSIQGRCLRSPRSTRFCHQCKHQLVARLALSLGAFIGVKVSDEQQAVLLSKL